MTGMGMALETGRGLGRQLAPQVGVQAERHAVTETGADDYGVGSVLNWLTGADKKAERAAKANKAAAELALQTERERQAFELKMAQLEASGGGAASGGRLFGLPFWAVGLGAAGVAVALWLVLKD